jgi:hypothetical protein
MTATQLHLAHEPATISRRWNVTFVWRSVRERVLRVPLVAKLLGANILIALVAVGAAVSGGQRAVIAFVCAALLISCAVNVLLVRLALAPLDDLERVADRVARGEWYARVTKSPVADPRIDGLRTTLNKLLEAINADHVRFHQVMESASCSGTDLIATARLHQGDTT